MDNNLQKIFTEIYANSVWGSGTHNSGQGSNDINIVNDYIDSISTFLKSLKFNELKIVDLGCGDFNIGSKIVQYSTEYIACDIVESVIIENKKRFFNLNVDFQVLDLVTDDLPKGNVAIIRQVLQHLSNQNIKKIVDKLNSMYEYVIVTEHIPKGNFISNIDISSSNQTRIKLNSGVVLTNKPFSLTPISEKIIGSIELGDTVLKTIVYQIK